jgi:hypothetical protein
MSQSLSNNDIINLVTNNNDLKDYIKNFKPVKDNFFLIVEKVCNYIENNYKVSRSNKYRIIIDILIKIINDLNITKNHQIYLMESIHTMVFDYEDELEKRKTVNISVQINEDNNHNNEEEFYETESLPTPMPEMESTPSTTPTTTPTPTPKPASPKETDLNDFNNIVNELYQTIYDNINNEKIEPENIPSQLIIIVGKVGSAISKYTDLSWDIKKKILISAFTKFQENIDKIFPGINEIDKNLIITALTSVPTLFEYFISITTNKYSNYMNRFMNNIFAFPQNRNN